MPCVPEGEFLRVVARLHDRFVKMYASAAAGGIMTEPRLHCARFVTSIEFPPTTRLSISDQRNFMSIARQPQGGVP